MDSAGWVSSVDIGGFLAGSIIIAAGDSHTRRELARDAATPVSYQFGLFQGDGIGERSVGTYRRALSDVLLTRVALRLEEVLARPRDLEQLYVALRGYLMLHQEKYLDAQDLARLMLFLWSPNLPRDSVEAMAALEGHLKAALEARPLQMIAPRNDALVTDEIGRAHV